MSDKTNRQFVAEKRNNFVKFCRECLKKRGNNKRYAEFEAKLKELEGLDINVFITGIVETMVPHKSAPLAYVKKMLYDHKLTEADFEPSELDKCSRYIECFIDVVC